MAGGIQQSASSKRKHRRRRATLMADINVTPMVDVMLVLLIIFMVTAPLMATGIKVNLPESDVSQLETDKEEPLQVLVDKRGDLFIQKTKVTMAELGAKLGEVTKQNKDTQIYVKGDKDVPYGTVILAISTINAAGYTKVGLVTQPKADTPEK